MTPAWSKERAVDMEKSRSVHDTLSNRPVGFVYGLTREYRRVEDEHSVFSLNSWKDGVAIPGRFEEEVPLGSEMRVY